MVKLAKPTGKIYTDIYSILPVQQIIGNRYILTLYKYGRNNILSKAKKNKRGVEIFKSLKNMEEKLTENHMTGNEDLVPTALQML